VPSLDRPFAFRIALFHINTGPIVIINIEPVLECDGINPIVKKLLIATFGFFLLTLLINACTSPEPDVTYEIVYVYQTATPVTATPTSTPSPTPTPTPTAQSGRVSGENRLSRLTTPVPQPGAPCGTVDILDFPIVPPDAENGRGGADYGVFRSRYNGYHTGEDWGISRGSNFGTPVYSIGHGLVTHAAPIGWGADKGTVIVQHTFPDGNTVLSFYGHLDPPSVVLRVGECVARGDKVGEIGDPRTPPHLHFEIRTIYPYQPTRGYVSVDPTELGWLPPSKFIWNYRNQTAPGVLWSQSYPWWKSEPIGRMGENTFVLANNLELIGVDLADGSIRFQHPLLNSLRDIVIDRVQPVLYLIDRSGQVEAYELIDSQDASNEHTTQLEVLWLQSMERSSSPSILPLPQGGVALSTGEKLIAYSTKGEALWMEDPFPVVQNWSIFKDSLYFTTQGDETELWRIYGSEPLVNLAKIGGKVAATDDLLWIYDESGIHVLRGSSNTAEQIYALPAAYPTLGDMMVLEDGSLLLAHTDIYDRRLIVFNTDGSLRWERSYSDALPGRPILLKIGDHPFLVVQNNSSFNTRIGVFSIDIEDIHLVRIFDGGARNAFPRATWASSIDGKTLLLNIGGSQLFLLDTDLALDGTSFVPTAP